MHMYGVNWALCIEPVGMHRGAPQNMLQQILYFSAYHPKELADRTDRMMILTHGRFIRASVKRPILYRLWEGLLGL